MKRVAAVALLVVVAAVCDDPLTKPTNVSSPPAAALVPAPQALVDAPAHLSGSSVCASFLRERVRLTARLRTAPKDTALLTRARSLALIITDACN